MNDTILIYDAQQNKTYMMHKARANHLCQSYPQRFKYTQQQQTNKKEENMPALPELLEALPNGSHHVKVIECRTVKSDRYDIQQEEITIVTDNGKKSKMWLSWNSRKKIDEAAHAGFVKIDEASQEWNVIIGATFTIVVANGKAVAWVSDKTES
jgi:hypothetical protein